jgi:hypothetical protein
MVLINFKNRSKCLRKTFLTIIVFPATVLFFVGCEKQSPKKEEKAPNVAIKAELAGFLIFEATKDCRIIGIPDLKECAANKLELMAEKMVGNSAKLALKSWDEYNYVCYGNYEIKYCDDLLRRAYLIAKRTPAEQEDYEAPEKPDIEN